jgi:hypothetical protein
MDSVSVRAPWCACALSLWVAACGDTPPPVVPEAPSAPASVAPPSAPEQAPTLRSEGGELLVEGVRAGTLDEGRAGPGFSIIEGLLPELERLKQSAPTPPRLRVVLPLDLDFQAAVSTFLTIARAGLFDVEVEGIKQSVSLRLFDEEVESSAIGRVIWARVATGATYLTRWPALTDEEVVWKGDPTPLVDAMRPDCVEASTTCPEVVVVTFTGEVTLGSMLEQLSALSAARGSRGPLSVDFTGASTLPMREPDGIGQVIRSGYPAFQRCYKTGLARSPGLTGRVRVRLSIGRDGHVAHAVAVSDEPGAEKDDVPAISDQAVVACVVAEFEKLEFEPAGLSTVNYPIVFTPG